MQNKEKLTLKLENEHLQLLRHIEKLKIFINYDKAFLSLTPLQQHLIDAQLNAMRAYSSILDLRIRSL